LDAERGQNSAPIYRWRIPALRPTPEMSIDLGEHNRGRNRALDRKWAEIRGDKAGRRKASLTMAGGKYQEQLKRPWRTFRW
jgi:hypothetical protein